MEESINVSFGKMSKNTELLTQSVGFLKNVVASVGIVAALWSGLEPLLRPILTMFKLIMMVVFMPLIPYMKQIATAMADMVNKTLEGQKKGGTPLESFTGGLGALFSPGNWTAIGTAIAAAIALSFASKSLGGIIALGLSAIIAWETIDKGDESTLADKLKGAGWAGLSAGIAALMFGAGPYSLAIGALVFSAVLSTSLIVDALSETDIKKKLLLMAGGSIMAGILAGGIVALLIGGGGAAAFVTIAVGTIVFAALLAFDFAKNAPKQIDEISTSLNAVNEDLKKQGSDFKLLENIAIPVVDTMKMIIGSLGFLIGGETKGSYPLVYSLNQASIKWGSMGSAAVTSINAVIENLNRIPTEIVTIHRIVTVYSSKNG